MIKVIRGKVKTSGRFYSPGEFITGLSEEGEAGLVFKGVAEYVPVFQEDSDSDPDQDAKVNSETGSGKETDDMEKPEETEETKNPEEPETDPEQETEAQEDVNIKFDPEDVMVQKPDKKSRK